MNFYVLFFSVGKPEGRLCFNLKVSSALGLKIKEVSFSTNDKICASYSTTSRLQCE